MVAIPSRDREPNGGDEQFMREVLSQLRQRIRGELFDTWFPALQLVGLQDDEAEFTVPNGFIRDWITRNYLAQLEQVVTIVGGRERRVRITPAPAGDDPQPVPESSIEARPPAPPSAVGSGDLAEMRRIADEVRQTFHALHQAYAREPAGEPAPAGARGDDQRLYNDGTLNARYTFDEFVVGSCNNLAHAAALAVAHNPGNSYNPLFLHGNVGLGKTHLLQAMCHYIKRARPGTRVLYMSCEDFTNRYIASVQSRTTENFRAYHRSADVLVIDDVEFLARKDQTQEEFFHSFNELYNQQKQIILSSDREPGDIPTLEERLVSRFRWGLCAEMAPPCFETRLAIVRRKARLQGVDLPEPVAKYIAERISSNIRELEGAVTNVVANATVTGREVSIEAARDILERNAPTQLPQIVSLPRVMSLITSEFALTAKDLRGKSRTQNISGPRQIGMYLARQLTEASLEEIGRFFGNRDHTTVLYSVRRVQKRTDDDRLFGELVDRLTARLSRPDSLVG